MPDDELCGGEDRRATGARHAVPHTRSSGAPANPDDRRAALSRCLRWTIPALDDCPAPRTTQSNLALAARPGPGDEILQARAADGARNQGVADHEGRRSADAERLGQADRFRRDIPRWRDPPCRGEGAGTSRPTLPARAMTLPSVSFPREPMTATWNSRYRPCFLEAIAARAAKRETGPRMGNSFQTMRSFLSGLQQVLHRLQRPFAIAALVVEELDEGDIALRVAGGPATSGWDRNALSCSRSAERTLAGLERERDAARSRPG